ncbi:AAA family ATPase [Arthrobacter sp. D2-10]
MSPPTRESRPACNRTAFNSALHRSDQYDATEASVSPAQGSALAIARILVDAGIPVFLARPALDADGAWDPCGGSGGSGYVLPPRWQQSKADPAVLDDYQPGDALAAVTGHTADVLDVDTHKGGDASKLDLQIGGVWPDVLGVQRTPSGGTHDFINPLRVGSRDGFTKGIDHKGGRADGSGRGFVWIGPTKKRSKVTGEIEEYRWETVPDPALIDSTDTSGEGIARIIEDARGAKGTAEAEVGAEAYDAMTPERRAQVDRYINSAVAGVTNELTFSDSMRPDARDARGRGWEKIQADAAKRLGALARADWNAYTLADAQKDFEEAAPTDTGWTAANVREKFKAQAHRGEPAPMPQLNGVDPDTTEDPEDRLARVRERFPRLDMAALLDPDRPRREWVISGLIPAGASVAFVAKAGSMKSLLLLAQSLAVARGDDNFAGLTIPRQRRVCYVDMENTEDDLEERITDLGVRPEDMQELIYLHLPSLTALDVREGGQQIADVCDAYGLAKGDMVVLDSFQRVVDGPENDSDTYRDFYKHTGFLLKKRGLTVVRTDNTGKDESKGSRGSSSKRDDVDIEFIIRRDQVESALHIAPGKVRINGIKSLSLTVVMDEDNQLTFTSAGDPFRDQVAEAMRELDGLGLPDDASQRKCEQAMKNTHSRIPREAIRQAVKERTARAKSARRTHGAPNFRTAP